MGLKDVAALAEAIVDAARLGLDPGSLAVLDRYQRWRRFDTMAMGVATDGLNRLFSNRSDVLRLVRDVGLGLVDRLPALKRFFIREAAGLIGEVPKLLQGRGVVESRIASGEDGGDSSHMLLSAYPRFAFGESLRQRHRQRPAP